MALKLKDLTREHHDSVERSEFAEILLSGRISPKLYQEYLNAQYANYSIVEHYVKVPDDVKEIFRAPFMLADLQELEDEYELDEIVDEMESVTEYREYIEGLAAEGRDEDILAHLYVRHFGDLHGGQIIKKRIPGSGKMYEFKDRKELIAKTRELLHDGMADEASRCFKFAEQMFEEIVTMYDTDDYFIDIE